MRNIKVLDSDEYECNATKNDFFFLNLYLEGHNLLK